MDTLDRKIQTLENELAVRAARESFIDYLRIMAEDPAAPEHYTQSAYTVKPIHRFMAETLQNVAEGEYAGRIVLISVPPRTGKTHQARSFCSWFAGRNPYDDLIYATYSDDFASDQGSDVRDQISSDRFRAVFPEVSLRAGNKSSKSMRTVQGGALKFSGGKGSITGRGGMILIVDDLIKDAEEASSQKVRDKKWEWFTDTFISRKMTSDATIIGIATRWHEDDWIGRMVDPENPAHDPELAANLKIINLPVFAEDNDPLGREPGELLWPERFTREDMEQRRRLNPRSFSALYMGQPTPLDGDFFKREYVRFYLPADLPPREGLRIFAASDHAVGTAQTADFTVLLIVGVDDRQNVYVLDCVWERMRTDRTIVRMLELMRKWRPLFWWAESGHISKSIGPFLRKRMLECDIYCAIDEVSPAADKVTRAQSIQARMSMGRVYFPKGAPWVARAVDELMKFPNGTYDDFVDTIAHIGLQLPRVTAPAYAPEKPGPKPGTHGFLKDQYRRQARAARTKQMRARR